MARYVNLRVEDMQDMRGLLVKDHLLLLVFLQIGTRARWKIKKSNNGLEQYEFFLSEEEYALFGLKRSQKGQIARKIMKLIGMKIIVKVESKTGSRGGNVYRLTNKSFLFPYSQISEQSRIKPGSKQGTNRDERNIQYSNKKYSDFLTAEQLQGMTEEGLVEHYWENHDLYRKTLGEDKTREIKELAVRQKAK